MTRLAILSIFLIQWADTISAKSYQVFELDGKYGLKNESGEVLIPPKYDNLGWSYGERRIINDVIGYQKNGLWGLISVKNKILFQSQFYSIQLLKEDLFKVSTKGKFSNQLFYGVIDAKGNTVLSFHYSHLQPLDNELLAGTYDYRKESFGLISYQGKVIIPIKYFKIESNGNFYHALSYNGKTDLYLGSDLIQSSLDDLYWEDGLLKAGKHGKVGAFDATGKVIAPIEYKSLVKVRDSLFMNSFPTWTVHNEHGIHFTWSCDSLRNLGEGSWVTYSNGRSKLIFPGLKEVNHHDYRVKDRANLLTIVENTHSRQWSVLNSSGTMILSGFDKIVFSENNFYGRRQKSWNIYSLSGNKINRFAFDRVKPGLPHQHLVSRNGFWGIIDFAGGKITNLMFDSIRVDHGLYYVQYIDRWGSIDKHGNWLVKPDYEKIASNGNLTYGKRGEVYHFYYDKELIMKTTQIPQFWIGQNLVTLGENNKFGVIGHLGGQILYPEYDSVDYDHPFIKAKKDDYWSLFLESGKQIIHPMDKVEKIGGISEGRALVRINRKWGFVDMNGKLRIANRYDSLLVFSHELAAFKIRNKWGFLDHDENIHIQPHFQSVSEFHNGLSIVEANGKFGLINLEGDIIVPLEYSRISRTSFNNYLVTDINENQGLLDKNGTFLLRPAFEQVIDKGKIIIKQNGLYGVLSAKGEHLFPISNNGVEVFENYIALMQLE